eukprot:SAG22_NODE_301_length_12744_cov_19.648189_18_plen_93_part_00
MAACWRGPTIHSHAHAHTIPTPQVRPPDAEKFFSLICSMAAAIIYGAVAATLSSIMTMLGAPHAEYHARMDGLKAWMVCAAELACVMAGLHD